MSILIKGMEMPEACPCELLGIGYDLCCNFTGGSPARVKEYYECCQNGTRPSWCPLVPVPPHGDLIDRDKLREKEFVHDGDAYAVVMARDIRNAPTIIPASEGKEDE